MNRGLSRERLELLAAHRTFPGNRPSHTILYRILDPRTLGHIIALYEHKILVEGVIWRLNSYDQRGVDCGDAADPPARRHRNGPECATIGGIPGSCRPAPKCTGRLRAPADRHGGRAEPGRGALQARTVRGQTVRADSLLTPLPPGQ